MMILFFLLAIEIAAYLIALVLASFFMWLLVGHYLQKDNDHG